MLGVAALAVIAGILILALGGGSHSRPRRPAYAGSSTPSLVKLASSYLHVQPSEVRERLREGETLGQIAGTKGGSRTGLIETLYASRAAAIRARHLPVSEEQLELRKLHRELTAQVDHARRQSRTVRRAAVYLELSEAELSAKLADGHTLAHVADTTPGHSRAGLIDAIVAPRRQAIEQARHAKAISAAAAGRALSRLRRRAERLIEQPGG